MKKGVAFANFVLLGDDEDRSISSNKSEQIAGRANLTILCNKGCKMIDQNSRKYQYDDNDDVKSENNLPS